MSIFYYLQISELLCFVTSLLAKMTILFLIRLNAFAAVFLGHKNRVSYIA
jgi:hypothetical protein